MTTDFLELESVTFTWIQAIDIELRHIVPPGWRIERDGAEYLVIMDSADDWHPRMRQVVNFIAFDTFALLRTEQRTTGPPCYEFVTANAQGEGVRITFTLGM